jgi:hypothetical protein
MYFNKKFVCLNNYRNLIAMKDIFFFIIIFDRIIKKTSHKKKLHTKKNAT